MLRKISWYIFYFALDGLKRSKIWRSIWLIVICARESRGTLSSAIKWVSFFAAADRRSRRRWALAKINCCWCSQRANSAENLFITRALRENRKSRQQNFLVKTNIWNVCRIMKISHEIRRWGEWFRENTKWSSSWQLAYHQFSALSVLSDSTCVFFRVEAHSRPISELKWNDTHIKNQRRATVLYQNLQYFVPENTNKKWINFGEIHSAIHWKKGRD